MAWIGISEAMLPGLCFGRVGTSDGYLTSDRVQCAARARAGVADLILFIVFVVASRYPIPRSILEHYGTLHLSIHMAGKPDIHRRFDCFKFTPFGSHHTHWHSIPLPHRPVIIASFMHDNDSLVVSRRLALPIGPIRALYWWHFPSIKKPGLSHRLLTFSSPPRP
jgi:hypothetical protein